VRPPAGRALLRIHLSNFERRHTAPLYQALVEQARREGLGGATVLQGFAGYIGSGPLLGDHPHALQVERPVVVEVVDEEEKLERFLDGVAGMLEGRPALVTLERVRVAPGSAGAEGT
jgi:uncharacterized protein